MPAVCTEERRQTAARFVPYARTIAARSGYDEDRDGEAMLALTRAAATWDGRGDFKPYARAAVMHATARRRRVMAPLPADVPDDRPTAVEAVAATDDERRLVIEVERLPIGEQEVVILRYGLGAGPALRRRDVAERLDLSVVRVGELERSALARLRRRMNRGQVA